MEIKDLKLDEVRSKLEEAYSFIPKEHSPEEINENTAEIEALIARESEIMQAAEKRAALVNAVINLPEAAVTRKFENTEERKVMNNVEMVSTPEYRSAFLKNLMGKDLGVEERALVTAAAAIPTQTLNKIFESMEYVSPILGKINLENIPQNLSIVADDTVNDAAWVAMGTAATDSADSVKNVTLAAYKLIKTVEVGADTSVMAIDAFESYLVGKLSNKIAKALENAVFNGTGASQPTGLLKAGVITNTGTFTKAGMTYADLLAIIADLPDHGYRAGAAFAMPSALFYGDVLPALTDKGSGLDVQAVEKMKVLGYDIIICDRIAANTLVFGNFSNYTMNITDGVKIESDKSVGFRTGSTVYRAMALVDGKPVNAAAFNSYTRAAV